MVQQSFYTGDKDMIGEAVDLLRQLISISSVSRHEMDTANLLEQFFSDKFIPVQRLKNNVIVQNKNFESCKPVILLNSHHDTVQPGDSWSMDPFKPEMRDGKLFGLGSNDAGGALVSLLMTFLSLYETANMPYNIIFVASAEEEVSGKDGMELVLKNLPDIDFAIVGEPTDMKMAVAEKGLIVLDCTAHGKAGHAARNEGINAIYKAMHDVDWFRTYHFKKVSGTLGEIKMTVTGIQAGSQHNVVPDVCDFVVDIRSTDAYSNEEMVDIIKKHVSSDVRPRSTRLQPSGLPGSHALLDVARSLGLKTFGSPTLSDMALMPFPAVKIGPGQSARSHMADEYIKPGEIESGIAVYMKLIRGLMELKIAADQKKKTM